MDRKKMIAALKPGVMLYMAQAWESTKDITIFRLEVVSVGKVHVTARNPNRSEDRAERVSIWNVTNSYCLSKREALTTLVEKSRRNIVADERSIERNKNAIELATKMLEEEKP